MSTTDDPSLTIQTASLWSEGANDIFSGSGGPWGYDPFFGQFGGTVSSAGLDSEPFADQIWNVSSGDEIVFVIAIQNRGDEPASDVLLRDTMPAGFAAPPEGTGVSVTDGAGYELDFTGDLFDPNGGLLIQDPLASYDPDSGSNVALITFTLESAANVAVPNAALQSVAQIVSYAASSGGPDLSGDAAAGSLAAATDVTTAGITASIAADQSITLLPPGQQASYDVTITLPAGEAQDLRIDEAFPQDGNSWLQLVSSQVISVGDNLSAPDEGTLQLDGTIDFGDVTDSGANTDAGADSIVVRVTVEGAGTAAGQGTLQTDVSAVNPNTPGGRWTDLLSSTLSLEAPNVPPTISGTSPDQSATDTIDTHPFAAVTLADPDVGQTETLTIALSDPLLGTLSGSGGSYNSASGTYTMQGSIASVQQTLQSLAFQAGAGDSGTEQFTLTLDDGSGGVATDDSTVLNVEASSPAASGVEHFPLASTGTVFTSTVGGSRTVDQVETYAGPVDYLQSQFIYDGSDPLAIAAQTPNIFIKSVAGSAAVQLLSGQNVVDAGHGSNFLISGTGQDVFYLDDRQPAVTWDTIVNFHSGDIVTLWGYQAGTSSYSWDSNAGAPGYTGSTMRVDLAGTGNTEASITFAGKTTMDTANYAVTTGSIDGNSYMTIFG